MSGMVTKKVSTMRNKRKGTPKKRKRSVEDQLKSKIDLKKASWSWEKHDPPTIVVKPCADFKDSYKVRPKGMTREEFFNQTHKAYVRGPLGPWAAASRKAISGVEIEANEEEKTITLEVNLGRLVCKFAISDVEGDTQKLGDFDKYPDISECLVNGTTDDVESAVRVMFEEEFALIYDRDWSKFSFHHEKIELDGVSFTLHSVGNLLTEEEKDQDRVNLTKYGSLQDLSMISPTTLFAPERKLICAVDVFDTLKDEDDMVIDGFPEHVNCTLRIPPGGSANLISVIGSSGECCIQ